MLLYRRMDYTAAQHRLAAHGSRLSALFMVLDLNSALGCEAGSPHSGPGFLTQQLQILRSGLGWGGDGRQLRGASQPIAREMPMMSFPVPACCGHSRPRRVTRHIARWAAVRVWQCMAPWFMDKTSNWNTITQRRVQIGDGKAKETVGPASRWQPTSQLETRHEATRGFAIGQRCLPVWC
ncbi:hypothetical protein LZ30DRAFT_719862 [Colletotrichum cereale]|nr:hypothetical protein LZ30DRAFT_719862 [Colletotrichum cereale]